MEETWLSHLVVPAPTLTPGLLWCSVIFNFIFSLACLFWPPFWLLFITSNFKETGGHATMLFHFSKLHKTCLWLTNYSVHLLVFFPLRPYSCGYPLSLYVSLLALSALAHSLDLQWSLVFSYLSTVPSVCAPRSHTTNSLFNLFPQFLHVRGFFFLTSHPTASALDSSRSPAWTPL